MDKSLKTKYKIAIGLATNRKVHPKTVLSLLEMVTYSDFDYHMIVSTFGFCCAENRNYIAAQATKNGCSHLLTVDDDMIYEKDTLEKLLAHDKDIIGGIYNVRRIAENPEVVEFLDDKRPEGLFECGALGGGLMLIKTDVFWKVPQPWYGYEWYPTGMVKKSIDWYFCHKAREAGYKIWCDANVKAKHIGDYEY